MPNQSPLSRPLGTSNSDWLDLHQYYESMVIILVPLSGYLVSSSQTKLMPTLNAGSSVSTSLIKSKSQHLFGSFLNPYSVKVVTNFFKFVTVHETVFTDLVVVSRKFLFGNTLTE